MFCVGEQSEPLRKKQCFEKFLTHSLRFLDQEKVLLRLDKIRLIPYLGRDKIWPNPESITSSVLKMSKFRPEEMFLSSKGAFLLEE
jgi:hypothetical protein